MNEDGGKEYKKYDYIIIGAGISGLLSTLMLSKRGKKCLLIEKNSYLGGVCFSRTIDGYCLDNGVHAITELDGGPLVSILDKYANFNVKFVPHGNYYIRVKGKTRPHIVAFPFTFRKFANASFLSKKDRLMLIKIIGDAITNNIIAPEKNNKSVDEVMSKYNFSKKS